MAGGLGRVKVSLHLDTTEAEARIAKFFQEIGQQGAKTDPLKGADKSFEQFEKKARALGFAWNETLKAFQDSNGATVGIDRMAKAITGIEADAKTMGVSFGIAAKAFTGFAAEAKAAEAKADGLGRTILTLDGSLKGLGLGAAGGQLRAMGAGAQAAVGQVSSLSAEAAALQSKIQGLGQGGTGLRTVSADAGQAAQSIKGAEEQAHLFSSSLSGVGASGGRELDTLATAISKTGTSLDTGKAKATAFDGTLRSMGAGGASGITAVNQAVLKTGEALGSGSAKVNQFGQAVATVGKAGLGGFSTLSAETQKVGTAADGSGAKVRTLAQIVGQVGSSTKLPNVALGLKEVGDGANRATSSLGPLAAEVTRAGAASTKLDPITTVLRTIAERTPVASQGIAKVGTTLAEAEKKAESFGGTIAEAFRQALLGIPQGIGQAIGNAFIAPLGALVHMIPQAVDEFLSLDKSIRLTLSIMGEGGDKFNELGAEILRVGAASAATTAEVGDVAQALAKAGFTMEGIKDALEPIVAGAEATGTAYGTMGDLVVSALGAFGLATSEARDVVDTFVVAANAANQDVTDFGEALKYVGPVAKSTGQSLQDMALATGLLSNAGIKGSTAGTSLRTVLTNLSIASAGAGEEFMGLVKGSEKLQGAMRVLGADMTDTNGQLLHGKELVYALRDSMQSLSTGERALISKALAGAEGMPTLNALINTTTESVETLATALDNRMGKAEESAAAQLAGLSGAFRQLEGGISSSMAAVGGVISMVLTPAVSAVNDLIGALGSLPTGVQQVVIALGLLGGTIGTIVVVMKALSTELQVSMGAKAVALIEQFVAAFTLAGIQSNIAAIVAAIGQLGVAVTANLTTGMLGAAKALNSLRDIGGIRDGIVALAGAIKAGFAQGAAQIAPAVVQLTLFDAAATEAAVAGAAAGAGGVAAGEGAKVAGAGALAATPPTVGLAGAFGTLLAAVLPFALAIAGLVLIWKVWEVRASAAKAATEGLEESQNRLESSTKAFTKTSEDQGKTWEESTGAIKSWSESVEDALGRFDKLMNFLSIGYAQFKMLLDLLQKVHIWNQTGAAIDAIKEKEEEWKQGMEKTEAQFRRNREQLQTLNPASKEYGRLASENSRAMNDLVANSEQRIKAIDKEIEELAKQPQLNREVIATLKEHKHSLEEGLPALREKAKLTDEDMKAAEAAGNANINYARSVATLGNEHEKANSKIDTAKLVNETAIRTQAKQGLISEGMERAKLAKVAVDTDNQKLAAANKYFTELKKLYEGGHISEEKYNQLKQEQEKDVEEQVKNRIEHEKELSEAIKAEITKRLDDYAKEVEAIGNNIVKLNGMIGSLVKIDSEGMAAYKSLGDEIAKGMIDAGERVKKERLDAIEEEKNSSLKNIDREKEARIRMIENSAMSDEQKTRAKANLEQAFTLQRQQAEDHFQAAKKQAEMEAAAQKKQIIQEQIALQQDAHLMQMEAKQVELELWRAEQEIQNQIAIQNAKVAIEKAKAEGAGPREMQALQNQLMLLGENAKLIQVSYGLKQRVLGVEDALGKQQIVTKAQAEGVNSAFQDQTLTIGQVRDGMAGFHGDVVEAANKITGLGKRLQSIPDEAETVAPRTRAAIAKPFAEAGPEMQANLRKSLQQLGFPPEVARLLANKATEALREGGAAGADAAAKEIVAKLPNSIPKERLRDSLIEAIKIGSKQGSESAEQVFAKLPNSIPKEEIVAIFSAAYGDGEKRLANLKLPPAAVESLKGGVQHGITEGATSGVAEGGKVAGPGFKDWGDLLAGFIKGGVEQGFTTTQPAATSWGDRLFKIVSDIFKGGLPGLPQAQSIATAGFQRLFAAMGNDLKSTMAEVTKTVTASTTTMVKSVPSKEISVEVRKGLVEPVREAREAVQGIQLNPGVVEGFHSVAGSSKTVGGSNIDKVLREAATQGKNLATATSSLAGGISNAIGPARTLASTLERAAEAALRAARGKWSGGDVAAGQEVTVNELGQEMFRSPSGVLSEINAPAFGTWVAPSSGTIIPAHISQKIREAREASRVSGALAAASGLQAVNVAAMVSGGDQGAIVAQLQRMGAGIGQIQNNITITSDRPVNDASRLMVEAAKLRAYRRD